MDPINRIAVMADLDGQHCQLKHEYNFVSVPADDTLVLEIGRDDGVTRDIKTHLTVPVCKDCLEGMISGRWLLLYCSECEKSNWVDRRLPKYKDQYGQYDMAVMMGCPDCTNTLEGIYFIKLNNEEVVAALIVD